MEEETEEKEEEMKMDQEKDTGGGLETAEEVIKENTNEWLML